MNTVVNFYTAKLLKRKDFDRKCSDYYTSTGGQYSNGEGDVIYEDGFMPGELERMLCFDYSDFNKIQKENYFLCPTVSEVVMWLYEKHGIWISVLHKRHSQGKHFAYNIKWVNGIETYLWEHSSPTEAYEEAIKYVLERLL